MTASAADPPPPLPEDGARASEPVSEATSWAPIVPALEAPQIRGEAAPAPMKDTADGPARFPCGRCGAALRYDPSADALVCGHCGHRQAARAEGPFAAATSSGRGGLVELDYATALADALDAVETEETRTARCEACGAEVRFDPNVHSTECAFCAEPVVTDTGAHRRIKPMGVAPFLISEGDAHTAVVRWLGGRWFAPSDLQAYARAEKRLAGVYLPFWTFDALARSTYSGERGDAYYVDAWTTVMRDGRARRVRRRVRKIRWSRKSGRLTRRFDDVLTPAARALPAKLAARAVGRNDWDLSALEPYAPEFLAGFRAEAYTVDLPAGFAAARDVMDTQIHRDARADIGGDRQRIHRISTDLSEVTFKHVLLPVWIAAYRYRDQSYRVLVNGRTGEVAGERPYSTLKIVATVVAALCAAAGVAGAVFWLQGR